MSLMIKGFEFPQSCRECWFIYPEGLHSGSCIFTDKYWGFEEDVPSKSRLPECPLVEIPTPHGRLIDAGALANKYERFHRILKGSNLMADKVRRDEIDMFLSELKCNAPTIIEAEAE